MNVTALFIKMNANKNKNSRMCKIFNDIIFVLNKNKISTFVSTYQVAGIFKRV